MKTPKLVLLAGFLATAVFAQDTPSAKDIAAKLSDALRDGASTARLKMDFTPSGGGKKEVLQLKVNALRSDAGTSVYYQVLWPKGHDGSFVLKKSPGSAPSGSVLEGSSVKPITNPQDGMFGSGLAYEDLVDNYFAWENQAITGNETIKGVPCVILESKPGKGDRSSYGGVRSWVDTKRMLPLRIEKYGPDGKLVRRINVTLVAKDDTGRTIPANFSIERPGQDSQTVLEGSNIKHDVKLGASDFAPDVLRAAPKEDAKPQ